MQEIVSTSPAMGCHLTQPLRLLTELPGYTGAKLLRPTPPLSEAEIQQAILKSLAMSGLRTELSERGAKLLWPPALLSEVEIQQAILKSLAMSGHLVAKLLWLLLLLVGALLDRTGR